MEYLTIDKVELKDKTVFLRADLNTTIKNNKPVCSPRIVEHAKTIAQLALKEAKVVILAHQGRKGDKDFTSLAEHAKILDREVKKINKKLRVEFVADICGEKAIEKIKTLESGQILLLENTRFLDCETEYEKTNKCELIDKLEPFCDVFVLDALSVAHRAHASVVGFKKPIKVAGPVLERELSALQKFNEQDRPVVLILGGAKIKDSTGILKYWLENNKADYILIGGLFAVVALKAMGKKIKQKIEGEEEIGQTLKELIEKHFAKIILPEDVVIKTKAKTKVVDVEKEIEQEIYDIGPKTAKKFSHIIAKAKKIIFNGPMGVYEKKGFEKGTKKVLEAITKSKAFSLVGGGNSADAIEKLKLKKEKFGYISLSGKAFIEYLTSGTLVGIEYLKGK
ncbi:MAG: phosphoglycerate kinase [Candidatus Micrarchaeota archaeon]|nr:phosphoglycerate kinase [Candidatus Micrarchaeota archaeon]